MPYFDVIVEYGAVGRPPRTDGSESNTPQAPGILTESERRERRIEILAEAVYGYLKRRGKLAARAGHMAGNSPEVGPSSEGQDSRRMS